MATIAEIRAQYPQYSDMSDADLAGALHAKFYSDIPRADFDAKIGLTPAPAPTPIRAAPVPKSEGMPGPRSVGGFLGNVGEGYVKMAEGIGQAIAHPLDTAKGVLDIGAGAVQNVLPKSVVDFVNNLDTPEGKAAAKQAVDVANAVGGDYKRKYGSVEALTNTLYNDPVSVAADLSTLLTGGAGLAGKAGMVSTASKLGTAAKVTNPLTPVVAPVNAFAKRNQNALQEAQTANAVRDETLRKAQEAGYVVTPGSVTPTGKNVMSERIAGKTRLEQAASVKNQAVTDKLAREAVGLEKNTPLTSEAMQQIRKEEFTKGYEPVNAIGKVGVDDQYVADLANIETKFTGANASFPGATPESVDKLIKTYLTDSFDAKDAVSASRTLREQAKANYRKGENDLAKAQSGVAKALEDQIERSLSATDTAEAEKILNQFRESRKRMAISHSIEDAIREGAGTVDAKKLAQAVQSGRYLSGDLKTVGEFANVFPKVNVPPSQIGTPGTGTMLGRSFGGTLGALAGLSAGGGIGGALGAAAGAAAPEAISTAMRKYLLSKTGQAKVAPTYEQNILLRNINDQAIRNALLASQAGNAPQNNLGR